MRPARRGERGRVVSDGGGDINRALGVLIGKVDEIGKQLAATRQDMTESEKKSDESRGNMHRRLDSVRTEMHEMKMTTASQAVAIDDLKESVAEMQTVTDDVKTMRQQAQGAGTLGHWLIRIGVGVLALAGWAVSVYTYLTGRPPP
jgi:DNA anti-recombination protein RmuC